MEQLLEVESLDEALSGSLDIIIKSLESEAGILWFVDKKTGRLFPIFHVGPHDISGVSVEVGEAGDHDEREGDEGGAQLRSWHT